MTEREIDWAAVEAEYRAGELLLREIAARHGTSMSTICMRARRRRWHRTGRKGDKAKVSDRRARERHRASLGRVHRLVRRLADELERRVAGEPSTLADAAQNGTTAQMVTALARAMSTLNAGEQTRMKEQMMNKEPEAEAHGGMGADAAWAEVERRLAALADTKETEDLS